MRHNAPVLSLVAAMLVPATAMFGARYLNPTPAQAGAALPSVDPPALGILWLSDLAQADPSQESTGSGPVRSPFWFDTDNTVNNRVIEQSTAPTPPPINRLVIPSFQLSTIVTSGRTPMAVIDGKPRKIGDEIRGGWTLLHIDGTARTVTIAHLSGREVTVGLKIAP